MVGLTSLATVADLPAELDVVAGLAWLALVAVRAVTGWRGGERALRLGEPLPSPGALTWLAGLVVLPGVGLGGCAVGRLLR